MFLWWKHCLWKIFIHDITQKLNLGQNSKPHIVTQLKNLKWDNLKNSNMYWSDKHKKNSNCYKILKLRLWPNSKTQILRQKNLKLKCSQNSKTQNMKTKFLVKCINSKSDNPKLKFWKTQLPMYLKKSLGKNNSTTDEMYSGHSFLFDVAEFFG